MLFRSVCPATQADTAPDYLVFASGAGVDAYFSSNKLDERTFPVCIGPVTARQLSLYTKTEPIVATETGVDGLVSAILQHHQR